MAYHEIPYLFLFLPIVLIAYQLTPREKRWCTLLLAGYVFFWSFSKWLVVFLMGTSLYTYGIGRWLEQARAGEQGLDREQKRKYKKKEKRILALGVIGLLGVLGYLKYYNFFAENVNGLLSILGQTGGLPARKLLVPIGISFYTLQAIGYMADVYWGKIPAERHPGKVALFLGFFPQIMEGPIALYSQTADSLFEGKNIESENLANGCVRILWGLFKKMVIADRLYRVVEAVFGHYQNYSGVMIAVGAVSYTLQLYMEFSGCMDIVIGSGKLFGITLPENFNQPFASKSAAEFWRRWHITLGVWFKTYVFYPVSVSAVMKKWNKFGKKHLGKYLTKLVGSAIALFPVWLFNGLWHGPQWNYIFYGMYYFVILLLEVALEPVRERFCNRFAGKKNAGWWQVFCTLKTWLIIFTGEMFFRAESLTAGFAMFRRLFAGPGIESLWDGTLLTMGLDMADYIVIVFGLLVVGIVSYKKEKGRWDGKLQTMRLPIRWSLYYALIFAVIFLGAYGVGYEQVDLIYAGF